MKARNGVAFALATVLLSCTTKNDASVELAAVCAMPDDATACTFSANCDKVLMTRPWVATRWSARALNSLDVLNHLALPIQINNRLQTNEDVSLHRLNTNDFTVEEFRLSFSSSPPLALPSRAFKLNQLVPAGGSTVAMVSVIPPETMATIDAADLPTIYNFRNAPNAYVDVTVKAYGHTRDGQTIETEGWTVPVDVFDVDVPGPTVRTFDPCVGTTVLGACPNRAQTASVACQ